MLRKGVLKFKGMICISLLKWEREMNEVIYGKVFLVSFIGFSFQGEKLNFI